MRVIESSMGGYVRGIEVWGICEGYSGMGGYVRVIESSIGGM